MPQKPNLFAEVGQVWRIRNDPIYHWDHILIGDKVIVSELSVDGHDGILRITNSSGNSVECWGPHFIMDFQLIEP